MARLADLLLFLLLLLPNLPTAAGGLDDADERLYQVQLSLAQKGDPRAQYFLGEMHEQGLGTKQDPEEAFKWYAKAAEAGDVLAKRKLSMRNEIETEIKSEKALETARPVHMTTVENPRLTATQTAKTSDTQAAEVEAKRQQAVKAARDKRRAAVRAMVLDRIKHPIGEPFE